MKKISHRGNINGRMPLFENQPSYIEGAIDKGFDVEIDLWRKNNKLYLGHDEPQYITNESYLHNHNIKNKLWVHCKNIEALHHLIYINSDLNYFFHQEDDVVLTSKKYIWTYPSSKLLLTTKSIAVMPELTKNWNIQSAYGVCSDVISQL